MEFSNKITEQLANKIINDVAEKSFYQETVRRLGTRGIRITLKENINDFFSLSELEKPVILEKINFVEITSYLQKM